MMQTSKPAVEVRAETSDLKVAQRYLAQAAALKENRKLKKEQLDEYLHKNGEYGEVDMQIKDLQTKKKGIKDKLMGSRSAVLINEKLKEIKEELDSVEGAMFGSIAQHEITTGQQLSFLQDDRGRKFKLKKKYQYKE